jgi:hypothetical protein
VVSCGDALPTTLSISAHDWPWENLGDGLLEQCGTGEEKKRSPLSNAPCAPFEAQLNTIRLGAIVASGGVGTDGEGFKRMVALFQGHTVIYIHEEGQNGSLMEFLPSSEGDLRWPRPLPTTAHSERG